LIQISVINRGPEEKILHLLPTLWFRNTWSWVKNHIKDRPSLRLIKSNGRRNIVEASHPTQGQRWLYCDVPDEFLFTENETNYERLFGVGNSSPYVKDGI